GGTRRAGHGPEVQQDGVAVELRQADGQALRVGQGKGRGALPGGDSCPGAARRARGLDGRRRGACDQKGGAEQDDNCQPYRPGHVQAPWAFPRPRQRTLRPYALLVALVACCLVVTWHGLLSPTGCAQLVRTV